METTALAYVTIVLAGVSLQSPEPVALEQCKALQVEQPQTLCIEVQEPCGKGADSKCVGKVTDKAAPAPKRKRTVYRARSKRSSSRPVTVGQLVQRAF